MDNITIIIIASLLSAGFSIYVLYKVMGSLMRKILGLEVLLNKNFFARGEAINIIMKLKPLITLYVPNIIVKIECHRYFEERNAFRDEERCEHDVLIRNEVCLEGKTFYAGCPVSMNTDIIVPFDSLPTKLEGNLTIKWFIYVIFEMPYFFNAIKELEIKVVYS
jgi:hypothetical protein